MNPTISIIIPVYNVEKYIHRCINSILNQTFKDFELILVNDGSTDNCGEICDFYGSIDDRVKVIHKNNRGVSDARNRGIDIAKGNYISFVDSDDFIELDMYESMYKKIEEDNADICICGIREIKEDGNIIQQYIPSNINLKEIITRAYPCNKLFNKELFKDNRFKVGRYYEDLELIPKLYLDTNNITYIKEIKYNYVKRDGSITSKVDDKILDWLLSYVDLKKYMIEKDIFNKYKNEFNDSCIKFGKTYIYHLYHYNIVSLIKKSKSIKQQLKYIDAVEDRQYNIFIIKRIYISFIRLLSLIKRKLIK